jgi:hypothetical protein
MQSLAAEISREAEASVRASRSADDDDTDPLQEIRRRLRKLTYGDMIAVAEQITGLEGYKPPANMEEMAAMLHRWSTTERSDEPQSPAVRSKTGFHIGCPAGHGDVAGERVLDVGAAQEAVHPDAVERHQHRDESDQRAP